MKVEHISSISFGIRPELNVAKENSKLFNEVADIFDKYNKQLKYNPDDIRLYKIIQNKRGLTFTEYKDGWEHKIKLGKKLTEELLGKPAQYIAKTFAKAAEIFALDDKLWFKNLKFTNSIIENKQLKMPDKQQVEYENVMDEIYNKYILPALKDRLKENDILSRAKIQI